MTVMLGDLLAEVHRAAALPGPSLRGEITAAGQRPEEFVRDAVVAFEREATADDWAMLMSAIRDAELPGNACLEAMIRWQLRRQRTNRAASAVHEDQAR